MAYEVTQLAVYIKYLTSHQMAAPPLLAPADLTGIIRLPKILTQMIQVHPIPTKTCYLMIASDHLVVDAGAVNAIALLNFRLIP